MKFCLIYDFLTEYGGIERLLVNHAKMLIEEGHDVEILTCHIDPDVLIKMGLEKIKIKNISSIKTKSEAISLTTSYLGINSLKFTNPDVFISYSFPANYMIRNRKEKKIGYVNHFPHFLYFNKKEKFSWANSTRGMKRKISVALSYTIGNWLKKLDKKLILMNDLNLVNSKFTKKGLDKLYNTNMVLNYPVLDPIFKPSNKKIKEKFIFSSGRVIPAKRFDLLIKACAHLKNKIPVYISGQYDDLKYKKFLENLAKKNKVDLKFLGKLSTEDLVKYYSSAQVFAFPIPKFEFGLVHAESIACGTPAIVWGDGGGQSEIVLNEVNGYYAKPYDLKDFASKIDKIIDTNFKKNNKEKIIRSSERFSYSTIKKELIHNITKVIDD